MSNWAVNAADFHYIDEYGDRIPNKMDGSIFIPDELKPEFYAISLVEKTGMSYDKVCNLRYDEYYRLSSLIRAKSWTPQTKSKHEKYI